MRLTCLNMHRLIDRRDSGLSPAEGLRLEEHLGGCTRCRAHANLLDGLTRLAAEQPVSLDAAARSRAISAALNAGSVARARLSLAPPRRGFVLLGAATAALALAVAVQRALTPAPAPVAVQPARAFDRVLSGQVEVAGGKQGAGERLNESAELFTTDGASVALAHAEVQLRAHTRARWNARARTLALPQGSALIEVDPARHESFRVETHAFVVTVLGTRFEVTQDAVHVLRGRVSVTPRADGRAVDPIVLAAGSPQADFELQPTAAEATPPLAEPAPVATAPRPRAQRGADKGSQPPAAKLPRDDDREVRDANPSALLEQARSQLAARDVTQARNTLRLAAPQLRESALRAQALSLEAECNLLERRFEAARDAYLRVARIFPTLPAAETALFAAARIEAEHGHSARARELLTRYLERYPSGSFAREAEHRIELLAAEPKR